MDVFNRPILYKKASREGDFFVMHLARIAFWFLPAEPEHRGLTAHTAWESMAVPTRD